MVVNKVFTRKPGAGYTNIQAEIWEPPLIWPTQMDPPLGPWNVPRPEMFLRGGLGGFFILESFPQSCNPAREGLDTPTSQFLTIKGVYLHPADGIECWVSPISTSTWANIT
jgi:hypothetical protein